ncbi:hypothetical protein [Enterococcus olivae]
MKFYGREIEIQDVINSKKAGDNSADRILKELIKIISDILLECNIIELPKNIYVSKNFPLFSEKEFIQYFNETAGSQSVLKLE